MPLIFSIFCKNKKQLIRCHGQTDAQEDGSTPSRYASGGINSNVREPLCVPSADALTVTVTVSTVDVSSTMAVPPLASSRRAESVPPFVLKFRTKSLFTMPPFTSLTSAVIVALLLASAGNSGRPSPSASGASVVRCIVGKVGFLSSLTGTPFSSSFNCHASGFKKYSGESCT
jgi:hypothetical protein